MLRNRRDGWDGVEPEAAGWESTSYDILYIFVFLPCSSCDTGHNLGNHGDFQLDRQTDFESWDSLTVSSTLFYTPCMLPSIVYHATLHTVSLTSKFSLSTNSMFLVFDFRHRPMTNRFEQASAPSPPRDVTIEGPGETLPPRAHRPSSPGAIGDDPHR